MPLHLIKGLGTDEEWQSGMENRTRATEAHARVQQERVNQNLSGIEEGDSSAMDLVS